MQTTLAQFNETESKDAFALQNSKLLKVELNMVTIQAKLGSMVAYQGDVSFEHSGSGGLGRMLKKAVSGEGTSLMKMTGTGEVFLADQAQDVHLIYLENDFITVNGPNLLAFDSGIDWDIKRVEGASSMMGGGLFNVQGRTCILVDDIVDSGGTLVNAAEALLEQGAEAVTAYITHGVLSGGAVARVTGSKLKELVITDSIQPTEAVRGARNIRVLPIATLIGEAIGRTAAEESVSSLFD